MSVEIQFTDSADTVTRGAIVTGLVAYNSDCTGINDHQHIALSVTDSDKNVVGGLWGRTGFGWLFVELLFVPEFLRGNGIGAELLSRAESEAVTRGCHGAWLDTFAFQARGFYEGLGYSCFGELENYPVGSARYFMKKELTREVDHR